METPEGTEGYVGVLKEGFVNQAEVQLTRKREVFEKLKKGTFSRVEADITSIWKGRGEPDLELQELVNKRHVSVSGDTPCCSNDKPKAGSWRVAYKSSIM